MLSHFFLLSENLWGGSEHMSITALKRQLSLQFNSLISYRCPRSLGSMFPRSIPLPWNLTAGTRSYPRCFNARFSNQIETCDREAG